jgi:hypothetical protein
MVTETQPQAWEASLMVTRTTPHTFLGWLMLPECRVAEWDSGHGTWGLGCGLTLTDELAGKEAIWGAAYRWAHLQHHEQGHTTYPWLLLETVESGDGWRKVAVTCGCKE